MTFSMYKKKTERERIEFLNKILELYIDRRHDIYMSHGYSSTTIQTRKDFEKHKGQGGFANKKIKKICVKFGYEKGKTFYFLDQVQGQEMLDKITENSGIENGLKIIKINRRMFYL